MKIISKKMSKGFTLLEMLVVVLIIGILAGIALPQYNRAVEKTRLAEALLNVSNLQRAIDAYVLVNGYNSARFTGKGEREILDFDAIETLDCTNNVDYCSNKYFAYSALCNGGYCAVTVCRVPAGEKNCSNSTYELGLTKRKNSDIWEKLCYYSEETEYICKSLESQGFEREEC